MLILAPSLCVAAPQVRIHTAAGGTVTVAVELARTPAERERGLMYRRHLPRAHGMLFMFPRAADHRFWMKNTPLSLDIVFIASNYRVVGMETRTVPYSERQLHAGRPSRYVLEVAAGFCAREGVQVGDTVDLVGVPGGSAEQRADDPGDVPGLRTATPPESP